MVDLAKEGYAAAEAASKTAERWQNLGFAENEIKRINAVVKDLKYNTNFSGGAVGDLILKFHGITHNVDEAAELVHFCKKNLQKGLVAYPTSLNYRKREQKRLLVD